MRSLALLLLLSVGLAAAAHDSIIVKMAEGGFAVQSGDELGQAVGDRLRRLSLPEGADAEAELARLRSMDGERADTSPCMVDSWARKDLETAAAAAAALAAAVPPDLLALRCRAAAAHAAAAPLPSALTPRQAWSGLTLTCPSTLRP